MNATKTFYKNVVKECEAQGISLAELSTRLGRSRSWMSDNIRKTVGISLESAKEISDVLGVYLSCLIEDGDMNMNL